MSILSQLKFHSVEPKSTAPSYESTSNSLKVIAVSNGAQRWEFVLTSQWLLFNDFRSVWAEANAVYGNKETFDQVVPLFSQAQGDISGVINPKSSYAKGTIEIEFVNYSPSAGDFFQVSNHSKVYQVRRIVSGIAEIYPPLFESISASQIVEAANVTFKVRLKGEPKKQKLDKKQLSRVVLPCIEDI